MTLCTSIDHGVVLTIKAPCSGCVGGNRVHVTPRLLRDCGHASALVVWWAALEVGVTRLYTLPSKGRLSEGHEMAKRP